VDLFRVVGGVGGRSPDVCWRADFGGDEAAVEEAEAFGQRPVIRVRFLREEEQRRVAIAALQVAEHLVIGAILFDDVNYMLDRWVLRRTGAAAPRVEVGDARRQPL